MASLSITEYDAQTYSSVHFFNLTETTPDYFVSPLYR
jgi:hypothetical protein